MSREGPESEKEAHTPLKSLTDRVGGSFLFTVLCQGLPVRVGTPTPRGDGWSPKDCGSGPEDGDTVTRRTVREVDFRRG